MSKFKLLIASLVMILLVLGCGRVADDPMTLGVIDPVTTTTTTTTGTGSTTTGTGSTTTGTGSTTTGTGSTTTGTGSTTTGTGTTTTGTGSTTTGTGATTTSTSATTSTSTSTTSTTTVTLDLTEPPAPTLVSPADGSYTMDSTPRVVWNEPSDPSGIMAYNLWIDAGPEIWVGAYTSRDVSSLADGSHTWKVRAQDGAGNWGDYSTIWSFTVDTVGPNVVSVLPADGSVGVACNGAEISVTFDEAMDPATINETKLTMYSISGIAIPGTVTYDDVTFKATFTPDTYLQYGMLYTVYIAHDITDLAGNTVGGSSYSFTTVAASFGNFIVANGDGVVASYGDYSEIGLDASDNMYIAHYDPINQDLCFSYYDGSWNTGTADSVNQVGMHTSLAVTDDGDAHISYTYMNGGDRRLRYVSKVGGFWQTVENVYSSADQKFYTSIGLDSGNNAHISFYEGCVADLMYSTNASGSWVTETVDNADIAEDTAIIVDDNDTVHIAYAYSLASDLDLNYISGEAGAWDTTQAVVHDLTTGYKQYKDMFQDADGYFHISYYDKTFDRICYATNSSGSWVSEIVGGTYRGEDTSIAVDAYGSVHISFYENVTKDLNYITNASGMWVNTVLDSASADVGRYTSIAIGTDGKIHISYKDSTNDDLKYTVSN